MELSPHRMISLLPSALSQLHGNLTPSHRVLRAAQTSGQFCLQRTSTYPLSPSQHSAVISFTPEGYGNKELISV